MRPFIVSLALVSVLAASAAAQVTTKRYSTKSGKNVLTERSRASTSRSDFYDYHNRKVGSSNTGDYGGVQSTRYADRNGTYLGRAVQRRDGNFSYYDRYGRSMGSANRASAGGASAYHYNFGGSRVGTSVNRRDGNSSFYGKSFNKSGGMTASPYSKR